MSPGHYMIDDVLAEFLESDVAILVAAGDDANRPTITRGFGIRVSEDRGQVTVFVTRGQSAAVLADAEQTKRIAVNATRITDYESYQLKGNNAQISKPSDKDKQRVDRYIKGVQSEMAKIGLTPKQRENIFKSHAAQPLVGITFALQEVYCQTPGPGAGKPREPS